MASRPERHSSRSCDPPLAAVLRALKADPDRRLRSARPKHHLGAAVVAGAGEVVAETAGIVRFPQADHSLGGLGFLCEDDPHGFVSHRACALRAMPATAVEAASADPAALNRPAMLGQRRQT